MSYLGCTIDIPEGSIESEAELCLGFLKTGPPEGNCVAPVLHVQTKPSNLCLKKALSVTLPLFACPAKLGESFQTELTLMSFQEGLWKEVPSPKLSFTQTSFQVTHFSGWTIQEDSGFCYKDIACYLFGTKNEEDNVLDMRMCVCANAVPEIKVSFLWLTLALTIQSTCPKYHYICNSKSKSQLHRKPKNLLI